MEIYIDESGSINNHNPSNKFFVISLIIPKNIKKLKRDYKRFVSYHYCDLKNLDAPKISSKSGKVLKSGNKMFINGKFKELKGSQFDYKMKKKFITFFTEHKDFEVYFIKINNQKLTNEFCGNTARCFNYVLKIAIEYFIKNSYFPDLDTYHLQIDERNESTESRYFLQDYLNTELKCKEITKNDFTVQYYDSKNNKLVQIADVMVNFYFSYLHSNNYKKEVKKLKQEKILKFVFEFPIP